MLNVTDGPTMMCVIMFTLSLGLNQVNNAEDHYVECY
jgi:hypothetical protein